MRNMGRVIEDYGPTEPVIGKVTLSDRWQQERERRMACGLDPCVSSLNSSVYGAYEKTITKITLCIFAFYIGMCRGVACFIFPDLDPFSFFMMSDVFGVVVLFITLRFIEKYIPSFLN
ncbi:hypothetical protein ACFL11_01575 [Patescibacteria group bacterium]